MDTIPAGFRLAIIPPGTGFTLLPRRRNRAIALRETLTRIQFLIAKYNVIAAHADRADFLPDLHERLDLLHSESPRIMALATVPIQHVYAAPPSRSELRAEARSLGMPARMRWERFPPIDLEERKQMARECSRAPVVHQPPPVQSRDPKLQAFYDFRRTAARRLSKTTGRPTPDILADTNWCAKIKAEYDEILTLELDL